MKSQTIGHVLFFMITAFVLYQPILSHTDYMLDVTVKAAAEHAAQVAALEGMVTEEMRDEIRNSLTAVGFSPSDIEIKASPANVVPRGERMDLWVSAPRMPMFLFRLVGDQPDRYVAHAYTTSEYVN